MAKKTKSNSKRLLVLAVALIVLVGLGISYASNRRNAPVSYGNDALGTPTQSAQSGDAAKTAQSSSTPTPVPNDSMKSTYATPVAGSFISDFHLSARSGGQFVVNTLSSNAANGSCSVTFTPSSGSPVTKSGTVVSTGQLTCDFGGVIAVSGNGSATLTVTGADGKTDTKTATF
ncbi:MAG: hypothetical protein ABIS59_04045 [Candidatus Saccharibacteria bacterium]